MKELNETTVFPLIFWRGGKWKWFYSQLWKQIAIVSFGKKNPPRKRFRFKPWLQITVSLLHTNYLFQKKNGFCAQSVNSNLAFQGKRGGKGNEKARFAGENTDILRFSLLSDVSNAWIFPLLHSARSLPGWKGDRDRRDREARRHGPRLCVPPTWKIVHVSAHDGGQNHHYPLRHIAFHQAVFSTRCRLWLSRSSVLAWSFPCSSNSRRLEIVFSALECIGSCNSVFSGRKWARRFARGYCSCDSHKGSTVFYTLSVGMFAKWFGVVIAFVVEDVEDLGKVVGEVTVGMGIIDGGSTVLIDFEWIFFCKRTEIKEIWKSHLLSSLGHGTKGFFFLCQFPFYFHSLCLMLIFPTPCYLAIRPALIKGAKIIARISSAPARVWTSIVTLGK